MGQSICLLSNNIGRHNIPAAGQQAKKEKEIRQGPIPVSPAKPAATIRCGFWYLLVELP